jgi:hypothetical protein
VYRLLRIGCASLVIAHAAPSWALTVRALSADELLARADRIVHARCVAVTTTQQRANLVVSEITLTVAETFKGRVADRVVVRQLGGPWRRFLPTPAVGDEVVLFLHAPSRVGLTSPVGLSQGFMRVVRPSGGVATLVGDARIVTALDGDSTAAAARTRGPAGTTAAVPLDAALAALRARMGGVP